MTVGALHFSAVATGIARRAIDSLVELAQTKTPTGVRGLLRERVQAQEAVARAEVLLESARAYRASIVADVWATAERGEPLSVEQRARLRLAGTNATECAVRAVDLMFNAGTTTALEDASPLSHCFRDVHAVAQNINVLPIFYEYAGRVLSASTPARRSSDSRPGLRLLPEGDVQAP
jgi:alkylation response protein AidB-like acyl-CoA dehydrogenase